MRGYSGACADARQSKPTPFKRPLRVAATVLDYLDPFGVVGGLLVLGGFGLLAWTNPYVAGGLALVLVGVALVVRSLVARMLQSFGMGGML